MRYLKFTIPLYNYSVILITLDEEDCKKGISVLDELRLEKEILDAVSEDCSKGSTDGAITFHNKSDHELVTFFYPMHSHKRAEECVMHELFHIVSDVSRHCGIDTEASAYMQGFIGVQILDFMTTKMDVCP